MDERGFKEYAFDCKMFAVIRIAAPDEKTARLLLDHGALPEAQRTVRFGNYDANLTLDDASPALIEIDGAFTDDCD